MPSMPSLNELAELRDLKEVPQSNLLRLEVEELLKESIVDLTGKSGEVCKENLFKLRELLLSLPARKNVNFETVSLPGLEPDVTWETDKPRTINFQPPQDVFLAGSFVLKNLTKGKRIVDVCVQMPPSCFDAKDYLNFRYLDKRRLYLAAIADALSSSTKSADNKKTPKGKASKKNLKSAKPEWKVSCSFWHGDQSKPLLVVEAPKQKGILSFKFNLIPVIAKDTFPLTRFMPNKNNVRRRKTLLRRRLDNREVASDDSEPPCPLYNMRVLEDIGEISLRQHLKSMYATSRTCAGFLNATVLVKTWARRRNLHGHVDSMSEFVLCMIMVYLIQQSILKRHMTGLQLFKAFIQHLASVDLSKIVMRLAAQDSENDSDGESDGEPNNDVVVVEDDEFKLYYPINLIAPCGRLNLAFRVTRASYAALRHEATMSQQILANPANGGRDSFESLFCTQLNFWNYFDNYFSFNVPLSPPDVGEPNQSDTNAVAELESNLCNGTWIEYLRWKAESLLEEGFVKTGRATLARVFVQAPNLWKPTQNAPKHHRLVVCIALNPENAFRLVDKGPDFSDEVATKTFRQFWGTKSELRRFQDGAIVEAVVWTDENGKTDKPRIPFLVAQHLLTHHEPFSLQTAESLRLVSITSPLTSLVEKVLETNFVPSWAEVVATQDGSQAAFRSAIESFASLERQLRTLKLPLELKTLEAADQALRYASVIPPFPHPLAFGRNDKAKFDVIQKWKANEKRKSAKKRKRTSTNWVSRVLRPLNIVLQLEHSGRWPDDVEAIAHMKVAFYLQIASQLESKSKGMVRCQVSKEFVDIMLNGYVFRLSIRHEREVDILLGKVQVGSIAKVAASHTTLTPKQLDEKKQIGEELYLRTIAKPLLHSKLQSLHHNQEYAQSMSMVVRLTKLWISGHGLSPHIGDEAIELLVAAVFKHSAPCSAPKSASSGFLRVLNLVSSWDWQNSPLVVDINDEISVEDSSSITQQFFQARDNGRAPPMCIIVPEDKARNWLPTWTSKSKPSSHALASIVSVAKDSALLLQSLYEGYAAGDVKFNDPLWNAVFHSSIHDSGCDAVIALDNVALLGVVEGGETSNDLGKIALYKNLASSAEDKAIVGLNPLDRYVDELCKYFEPYAEFYTDGLQGTQVGVKWNKSVGDNAVPFRVAAAAFAKPDPESADELKLKLNREELLHTMAELGSGIVTHVELVDNE